MIGRRKHEQWITAAAMLDKIPGFPPLVAQEIRKRAGKALAKAKPYKPAVRLPRGSKPSMPKLKKELDRVFSIVIRTSKINAEGVTHCVTCGRVDHWKNMDAGHYVPRQDLATRWDPWNVWPQCKPCNGFRGGEPEKMAAWIDRVYGAGAAAKLREKAKTPFRLNRAWMESQIDWYKVQIGEANPGASPRPEGAPPEGSNPGTIEAKSGTRDSSSAFGENKSGKTTAAHPERKP
jgi:5-methylcytosine-specific restriction endonuclease McrA